MSLYPSGSYFCFKNGYRIYIEYPGYAEKETVIVIYKGNDKVEEIRNFEAYDDQNLNILLKYRDLK